MGEDSGHEGSEPPPPPRPPAAAAPPSVARTIGQVLRGIPSWVNVVAGLIAGGTAIWVFVVPVLWGPRIVVSATCTNHEIVLEMENRGGREARVGPPSFAIHSPDRDNEIDLRPYLVDDEDQDGRVDVAAGQRGRLKYVNSLDFFAEAESANNNCRFDLTLPVGGERPVPGSCRCVYSGP
jgi:hypothetical protein